MVVTLAPPARRVRRVRRLARAVAFTAVILTACMGLVVQSAQPAAAFDIGPLAKAGLENGLKIGKGASLIGRFSNPVGWAITAGAATWWAYDNRDAIIDFLHGPETPRTLQDFAEADPDFDSGGPEDPANRLWENNNHKVEYVTHTDSTITLKVHVKSCPNGCGYFSNNFTFTAANTTPQTQVTCKTLYGGDQTRVYPNINQGGLATIPLGRTSAGGLLDGQVTLEPCNPGEQLLAIRYGAPANQAGQVVVNWARPGHALPEGDVTFAEAKIQARCKNAVTGQTATLDTTSEWGDSGTVAIPSCKQHLGDDWYGTGITIAPAKPEIDNEPIDPEIEVPDFPPLDWDELIPSEEDAQPCQGTKHGCGLSVWIDNNPCQIGVPVCADWDLINKKNPERVECRWGEKAVDDKWCLPLAAYYNATSGSTKTDPGTHTTPETNAPTDPHTPPPEVGVGVDTLPTPKGGAAEDVDSQAECFPHGWGMFNPFEWVYKPVKCAITWAFKPKTPFSVRIDRMAGAFSGRAPFSWAASLASLPGSVGGSGCPSWSFTFKGHDYPVLCGTTVGNTLHQYRPLTTVLVVGAAVYPMLRALVYAFFPVVKPVPND